MIDTKRIFSAVIGLATGIAMSGATMVVPLVAQADTTSDLQAQITALLAQIQTLQSQLSASGGTTVGAYNFTKLLKVGSRGTEVTNLQTLLGVSPATGYFGSKTKAAVVAFQAQNGLTADGIVGAKSRAVLNGMGGSTTGGGTTGGGTTVPVAGGISVSSATQPTASLAPGDAARVPFTKVTLTAGSSDVTVNGIKVERTGLAVDANFAGIVLLDDTGAQVGIAKTFNSLHQATLGESFVLKAGQSKTYTIAGNMAAKATLATYAGQVAYLSVNGVDTTATVTGTFPITGAGHTINGTLTVGSVTNARGPLDPNGAQNKEVGTTGYTFSSVKFTAGSVEKIRIKSIRWNQSGSASATSDLANVKTVVSGVPYDTAVSSDGKYYTASFGDGLVVDKGNSTEISIKADIISGSGRTIAFDLYKNTDVYITGETYGYGLTPPTSGTGFAATNPWYDASVVTVTGGSANTISKSNTVAAQNIAVLLANQPLAGYEVEIKGEPVTIARMIFNVTAAGDAAEHITNISLFDQNGAVVAGPVDAVGTGTGGTITFTDTVTFPVGKTVLSMKGQLGSTFVSNDTVQASTTPSTQWTTVTGQNTGNTISLATFSSAITANLMTVKAGALAISVSSQPTARTVIAGSTGFEFARYILDAGQSGEDVRLSSFIASTSIATITASQLTNCNLYDGATNVTGNTSVTLAAGNNTFTFNGTGLIVSKGTSKTLSMKCDLSAGATSGTVYWGMADTSATYTGATGNSSGIEVAETMTAALGQAMAASTSGTYTTTADSSLLYRAVPAGTTGVTLASFRFTAGASEAINLKQIALELGNTASNSPADLVGERVTLWNGATQIGSAQFGGANPDNATSTILTPAPLIAAGDSVLITVKGDLSAQNINEGTPGAFLAITYDASNNGSNGNYATGVSSQTTIDGSTATDVTSNGARIFRTVPTVAVTSNGGTLTAGGDLYKFTVTNGNTRDVVFKKFSFAVATTGGAVSAYTLYGDGVAFKAATTNADDAGTLLEITADAASLAKIVPANSTKTYILKAATAVDTASVSETLNISLLADTSYPSLATLMGTVTTVEAGGADTDNIIWSPFSTTTPVADSATESNLDWTNGYGLPGFPANAAFPTQTWTRAN